MAGRQLSALATSQGVPNHLPRPGSWVSELFFRLPPLPPRPRPCLGESPRPRPPPLRSPPGTPRGRWGSRWRLDFTLGYRAGGCPSVQRQRTGAGALAGRGRRRRGMGRGGGARSMRGTAGGRPGPASALGAPRGGSGLAPCVPPGHFRFQSGLLRDPGGRSQSKTIHPPGAGEGQC